MDYEKKYKEAKKWIESIYSELSHEQQMEAEAFFPELKESEDERIRKGFVKAVSGTFEGTKLFDTDVTREEALAWLEKQEGCEYIKKDWLEHIKQSWYKEGFIDGKYTPKEWTINDATTLNELIDFLENGTVKLQHDLILYANWLKTQFSPIEKQGEQKSITIDIDKMVSKYSHTKDGNFGLPVNCQVRAYRQGINDALNLSSGIEKQGEPIDKGEISDGYHTFNELYYYRMLYNAAFFNLLPKEWVHKSKRHHDGEECFGGGWFIVMANLPTGQISNHYELKDWELFQIPEKEVVDEWDGHTPQEAAERLHKYLLEKQGEQKPILDFKAKDWYASKVDGKIHNIYNSVDRIEPKFKVGDIIINIHYKWDGKHRIREITDGKYIFDGGSYINIKEQDSWELANKVEPKFKVGDLIRLKDGDGLEWTIKEMHHDGYYTIVCEDRDDFIYLDDRWELVGKLVDKIEAKFHEGEWVVQGYNILKIKCVGDTYYCFETVSGYVDDMLISEIDSQFHLWTIQDAKDGDVLCTYECYEPKIVFILKGTPKKHYALSYHCYYNIMYPHFAPDSEKGCLAPNDEDVKPATKEQRDILFAKMKEAGYEWDAEKKELKKISQRMVSAEAKEALYDKPINQ